MPVNAIEHGEAIRCDVIFPVQPLRRVVPLSAGNLGAVALASRVAADVDEGVGQAAALPQGEFG